MPTQKIIFIFLLQNTLYNYKISYLCEKHKNMEDFKAQSNDIGQIIDFGPIEDKSKDIIKVIGVGGGGCNAVNNMFNEGIASVTFAVINTDSKALKSSPVTVKVPIGDTGLGAGANPEVGKEAAKMSIDQIHRLLDDGTKMCFVTAGMGGGTGTGAAPVIAGEAKSMGILTIGIVTIPFYFEKRKKIIKALQGVEELRKNVDALLIINNERISDIYSDSEVTVKEAFKRADQILCDATKSISELITVEGDINLDFKDVETTLRGGGGAIMAIGRGEGEHRVEKAVIDALDSPLLYGSDLDSATRILFNIYTSKDHSLRVREMNDIDEFMDKLNPNIDVIWGVSDDDSLGEAAKVTILATGFEDKFAPKFSLKDNEAYVEKLIEQLYRPYKKNDYFKDEDDDSTKENTTTEVKDQSIDGIEVTITTNTPTESAPSPTPTPVPTPEPEKPKRPSFVERAKMILNKLGELTEEP